MFSRTTRDALFLLLLMAAVTFGDRTAKVLAQDAATGGTAVLSAAATLYSQPPSVSGGLLQSSWWEPDGSDWDQYLWDGFTLVANQSIGEIQWRGGYDPAKFGSGGPVLDFTVAIYASIPAGSQPDIVAPLVQYQTGGNAGETAAGTVGGVSMFDYALVLPTPFQATAGTKYWLHLKAAQNGVPDWGLSKGTGGDGQYFRCIASGADKAYQILAGDGAFTLLASTPSLTVTSNGTYDGWLLELSEASSLGGSFNASAATIRLGDDAANRQYRAILSFNTAKLPDNAVIQSAVLKIKQSGTPLGSDPFTVLGNLRVDVRKGSFGGAAALTSGDFEAPASVGGVATFSNPPVNGWYSANLNSAGRKRINRNGLTQFRLRFEIPSDGNNQADFMKFVSGNAAGNRPVLVITYTLP